MSKVHLVVALLCRVALRRYNGSHDSSGLGWLVLKPNPTQEGGRFSLELKKQSCGLDLPIDADVAKPLLVWLTYHDILSFFCWLMVVLKIPLNTLQFTYVEFAPE